MNQRKQYPNVIFNNLEFQNLKWPTPSNFNITFKETEWTPDLQSSKMNRKKVMNLEKQTAIENEQLINYSEFRKWTLTEMKSY